MVLSKIFINKPIMHILLGTIVGIVIYLLGNQWSTAFIAVLFLVLVYKFYDLNCFKLILAFFIVGYLSIFSYFNLVGNKYGVYKVRINEVYKQDSIATLQGRKVYINYKEGSFEKDEIIKFKGKFKRNKNVDTGIVGDLFVEEIVERKKDIIYKIRKIPAGFNSYINKYLNESDSAVLTALTFGNKEFLSKEEKDNFKKLGVIHLICISGFHIAMVYEIVKRMLGWKFALLLSLVYVVITGLTPSALRAFIMITTLSLATIFFRKYDNKSALAFSALILLILKPINIIDVGFHLSYLATLGIILIYNFLNRGFYRLYKILRESIALSLSAQLFVYPYMLVVFKSFSMNFLIGSFLLTPIIGIMLPLGLIALIAFFSSVDIKFLEFIFKIVFFFYNLIINLLEYIAAPMIYSGLFFAIGYMLMIICFYMHYKKVSKFKFKELGYFIFLAVVLGSFNFGVTISVFNSNFNKSIIIKNGFNKVAYTYSDNEYFKEEIKKEYSLSNVEELKEKEALKIDDDFYLCFNNKIESSFIMLKENKYDIIDLLNKEKRLYHKGKFIYIDERGTVN